MFSTPPLLSVLMVCLHLFLSVMHLNLKPSGQMCCGGLRLSLAVWGKKLFWSGSLVCLFRLFYLVVCVCVEKWTMLICLHHVHSFL